MVSKLLARKSTHIQTVYKNIRNSETTPMPNQFHSILVNEAVKLITGCGFKNSTASQTNCKKLMRKK